MGFIDNLAFGLFSITVAGLMLLYSAVSIYLSYKKNPKTLSESIKNAAVPLFFLGGYFVIIGLFGQFTWTLPGAYNILFDDPLIAFGIILLAFATIARVGGNMEYVGFLSLLFGVMVIIYGITGYNVGLTLAPIALLAMYFFFGLTGILFYPISLAIQKKSTGTWTIILIGLFCLSIFAGSCISGYIGFEAIGGHLLNPP